MPFSPSGINGLVKVTNTTKATITSQQTTFGLGLELRLWSCGVNICEFDVLNIRRDRRPSLVAALA